MLAKLNTPYTLMLPKKANALAAELNTEDDGWTYEAQHDPKGTGWSFVVIKDEDGNTVGNL